VPAARDATLNCGLTAASGRTPRDAIAREGRSTHNCHSRQLVELHPMPKAAPAGPHRISRP
jgi:hypothetical protein